MSIKSQAITLTGAGTYETPYFLHVNETCFADAERLPGAYLMRWRSTNPKREIAKVLRDFYSSIHEDITDNNYQKIIGEPGIYEIFNGSFAPTVSASSEGVDISLGKIRFVAALDAYCANDSAVDEYFQKDFKENIGSIRVVTPYCDMFIEQYGDEHGGNYILTIMGDDRINLGKQIAHTMKRTIKNEAVRTHPLLETVISDLIERLREQEAEE